MKAKKVIKAAKKLATHPATIAAGQVLVTSALKAWKANAKKR